MKRRSLLRLALSALGAVGALALAARRTGAPGPEVMGGPGLMLPRLGAPVRAIPSAEASTGVPIVLLTNAASTNPFGPYLSEVLRAEGLTSFDVADVRAIAEADLNRHSLAILVEGPIDAIAAARLDRYVRAGGSLIAMRPDRRLAPMLGLEAAPGILQGGYLRLERQTGASWGARDEPLRFHGEADTYTLAGARPIAWLYRDADLATGHPAVTMRKLGSGVAAMWAFDLARDVAYTRQGDARCCDEERDGLGDLAAVDMFVHGWVDAERIHIPQADELQRLLVGMMAGALEGEHPLPRLWYFPSDVDGLLIATGDSHGNPVPWIEHALDVVERRGGRMTVYYSPPAPIPPRDTPRGIARELRRLASTIPLVGPIVANPFLPPRADQIAAWRERGHEFAIHPYVEEGVDRGYRAMRAAFESMGAGSASKTVRTHRVLWSGWVETARIQAEHGIGLNVDYYHLSPALRDQTGRWVYGHFTGSALPMKQVDEQGIILDVYQQLTQLADEHLLKVYEWGPNLSAEEALEVSRTLIDESLANGYGPSVAQFHVDGFNPNVVFHSDAVRWMEGTVDHAKSRGVPIWSAEQWLEFVQQRRATSVTSLKWDAEHRLLRLSVEAGGSSATPIGLMLPSKYLRMRLDEVRIDGAAAAGRDKTIGGLDYRIVSVEPGRHDVDVTYLPQE